LGASHDDEPREVLLLCECKTLRDWGDGSEPLSGAVEEFVLVQEDSHGVACTVGGKDLSDGTVSSRGVPEAPDEVAAGLPDECAARDACVFPVGAGRDTVPEFVGCEEPLVGKASNQLVLGADEKALEGAFGLCSGGGCERGCTDTFDLAEVESRDGGRVVAGSADARLPPGGAFVGDDE
jgi:hypothetical protein